MPCHIAKLLQDKFVSASSESVVMSKELVMVPEVVIYSELVFQKVDYRTSDEKGPFDIVLPV